MFLEKKEIREAKAKSAERPHKKHTHTSLFPDWLTELNSARCMMIAELWGDVDYDERDDDDDDDYNAMLCWEAAEEREIKNTGTGHHQKKKGWLMTVSGTLFFTTRHAGEMRREKKIVSLLPLLLRHSYYYFSTLTPQKNTLYTKVQWLQVELINCT